MRKLAKQCVLFPFVVQLFAAGYSDGTNKTPEGEIGKKSPDPGKKSEGEGVTPGYNSKIPEQSEAATPNKLTLDERADGRILLFDGKTLSGWKIKGEAKVEDGVLVLGGGDQETIAVPTSLFGENLEIRWQFSTRVTATDLPEFVFKFGRPGDSFTRSFSLPRLNGDTVRFRRCEIVLNYDAENKTHLSSLTSGDGKSNAQGKSTNVPRSSTSIRFIVPQNCQLRLHSLKLRPTKATVGLFSFPPSGTR